MFIYLRLRQPRTVITMTTSGRAVRLVECCNCANEFVYAVQRSVTRQGSAANYSETPLIEQGLGEKAASDLARALDGAVEPIPCPHCYLYQPHMVAEVRARRAASQRLFGLSLAAVLLLTGAVTLAVAAAQEMVIGLMIGGAFLVAAAGCTLVTLSRASWTMRLFDPNDQPFDGKAAIAERCAMPRSTFEANQLLARQAEFEAWAKQLRPRVWHEPVPDFVWPIWVSRRQLLSADTLNIALPVGESEPLPVGVDLPLRREVYRTLNDQPIRFVCEVHIYPQFDDA